jgi:hypothetical protein
MEATVNINYKHQSFDYIYDMIKYNNNILFTSTGNKLFNKKTIYFSVNFKKYIRIKDNIIFRMNISSVSEIDIHNRRIVDTQNNLLELRVNKDLIFLESNKEITKERKKEFSDLILFLIEFHESRFPKEMLTFLKLLLI